MMGVFLCDENIWETPTIDYYHETNSNPLWVPAGLEGFIRYYDDGINYAVKDWQFSLDSLAQLYNRMDLYMTLNLIDCGAVPLPPRNPGHIQPPVNLPTYPNNPSYSSPLQPASVTATSTEVHFDYLNRHIMTTPSQKYFEFDVSITDDVDTGYLHTAVFTVGYSGLIFGYNIVSHSNVEVTTTGSLSGTSAYFINPYDDPNDSSRLVIEIIPDTNSSDALVNLPDAGPNLYPAVHIRIAIADCGFSGAVSMLWANPFVAPSWSSSSSPSAAVPVNYGLPYWSTVLGFPSCGIHIDAISASSYPITGGTQDTITIAGLGFDTARMGGNVWMRTANDNGSYIHLDSDDYVFWNDSTIKFVLPGDGTYVDSSGSLGVPGSGYIKVKNDVGDSTQSDSVDVYYSIASTYNSTHNKKYMYQLGNLFSFQHGYEFRIDTAFEQNAHPDSWDAIDVAIKEWVCLSGVNFILGDTLTPRGYGAAIDTICRIQFGRTTSESTIAQTERSKVLGPGCDLVLTEEIDIVIDSTRKDSLWWDTNCHHDVPSGKYDGYAAILHELGHAHSLNHINDPHAIMYWLDKGKNGVMANQRNVFIKFDPPAEDAANYVTAKAADPFLLSGGCFASLLGVRTILDCDSLPRLAGCGPIWVQEISRILTDIKVFPNPAQSKITFDFNSNISVAGSFRVKDIFGREVYAIRMNVKPGSNEISVDIKGLQAGVYCIGFESQYENVFAKFVKE